MLTTRRSLLFAASLAATPIPAWARALSSGVFSHGVASGDLLADAVIIWTRFVSPSEGRIGWEVSQDENFARVARRGEASARAANDFCVKADVRGLEPGRPYFYRFLSASGPSPTGRTRTAPRGNVESVTAALFSCANLPFGYFHAYGHAAAREDIDVVLHVGDYLYEIQRGAYPSAAESIPGRVIDPIGELHSVTDYYQRYACYAVDSDLQELRRLKPICAVWDDHEFLDNTYHTGAERFHPETDGVWADRVAGATKAYFDWMPIRRPDPSQKRLYRSFDWGNLARFIMLDTRFIGRDAQPEYGPLFAQLDAPGADGPALAARFRREVLDNPNRQMMGAAQESWLAASLAESKSSGQPWQVIGQQVVVNDQLAAAGASRLLPTTTSAGSRRYYENNERLAALNLPFNLDSWSGYPAARARFLEACVANAANAVVLAGDSHNCWLHNLPAASANRLAAIEFAGGSVSSPGLERTLTGAGPGQREEMIRAANPNLAWCDVTHRGYGALKFTRTACEADWVAFENVRTSEKAPPSVTRISSAAGASAGPGAWSVAT